MSFPFNNRVRICARLTKVVCHSGRRRRRRRRNAALRVFPKDLNFYCLIVVRCKRIIEGNTINLNKMRYTLTRWVFSISGRGQVLFHHLFHTWYRGAGPQGVHCYIHPEVIYDGNWVLLHEFNEIKLMKPKLYHQTSLLTFHDSQLSKLYFFGKNYP